MRGSLRAQMSEKHFIVKIQNRNGDHENSYVRLLVSDCEKNACQTALISECHGELEQLSFEDGGVYDYNGENHYSVRSCVEVAPEDVATLQRFL
uniref:Uncharacterized protein n=47 Tax=Enterobacteriaceae TaxID=543 RepID=A0A6G8F8Q0_ECOLX|nr:hypothetical protein p33_00313 [Escherichia coli]